MGCKKMLMWVAAKARSAQLRVQSRMYRTSAQWQQNPLNPKNVALPAEDPVELDRQLREMAPALGYAYRELSVDPADYTAFKARFQAPRLYAVGYKDKKTLEHFISFKLLDLGPGDLYVDVGSEGSPFPRMFRNVGIRAFSQDLSYPSGVHGWRIGSSAAAMPLADASVDKVSLQCAFEHFEGRADTGLVRELSRVLRKGGRCIIVPLYLSNTFHNIVDPLLTRTGVEFDEDSMRIAETDLGGRFERYYSPQALGRIVRPEWGLIYTLYRVTNLDSIIGPGPSAARRVRYCLSVDKPAY